ncbi:MAG TPA: PfkB family carbohydrate kinase [Armatimonadota bacterium]|nr:PfkB family carbohydrate kinase [Armatimonadota bacterium]
MIGTGGIGSGAFFALEGDHTLGREESRGGRFLDRRDYCKLHIISHYVHTLLGPDFTVLPIGAVGEDDAGKTLLAEMREAGLPLDYVRVLPGEQTLYSFCVVYPDGSGGNMTTTDSACARVDAAAVRAVEPAFARFADRGIALAVPEVPLAARAEVLRLGTAYGFLRVASFASAEVEEAWTLLPAVDLLAVNLDEAAAIAGLQDFDLSVPEIAALACDVLRQRQPALRVSITAGRAGSWCCDGGTLTHVPAVPVDAVSTAGAGDAHLSGVLVGLVHGLPLVDAMRLGALTGALAVTSPHTIHPDITRATLARFAAEQGGEGLGIRGSGPSRCTLPRPS